MALKPRGLLVVVFASLPAVARAQAIGPEFQVNTYTFSSQSSAAIATGPAGRFVVIWDSNTQDGDWHGIFGRRYDASGSPLGGEFEVNTHTTDFQTQPDVSAAADGRFVVVWHSYGGQDGSLTGVFGRRYDAAGEPASGEFQVNTYTTDNQRAARVASDAAGNVVVVWHSLGQDGSSEGVFGRRYDASGNPLADEFQVNTYTTGRQHYPALAGTPDGGFVVVWVSHGPDGSLSGIQGRRYDASGSPLGGEFQVNTYTTDYQFEPDVSAALDGSFVVVWTDYGGHDGSAYGIFGQRFDGSGNRVGGEFQVNANTLGYQYRPAIVSEPAGGFVVVWNGESGASVTDVFGRRFDASASPLGGEFRVNTHTADRQAVPEMALDSRGEFVVVWQSMYQDGHLYGVFGRRFTLGLKGDFNADAKPDVLFRHQVSGKNAVWFMDGITRIAGTFTSPALLPDTHWQAVGTADLSGDHKTDVLWRHAGSGKNVAWFMNGVTRTAGTFTNPDQLPDTNWRIVGTGDFDVDGHVDVLWRHGLSGRNVVWFMEGITRTAGSFTNPAQLPDTSWQVVGVGDFSTPADGKPDIVFRHAISGKNAVWLMDGITRTLGVFTNPDALTDTNWRISAVGDYDGDSRMDLVWRHAISGKIAVWLMEGVTRTAGVFTNPDTLPDTHWRIVGPT